MAMCPDIYMQSCLLSEINVKYMVQKPYLNV